MSTFWTVCWLLVGILALLCAFGNLILTAMKKHRWWRALLFASLSCGVLSVLCAVQMVNDAVQAKDWDGMTDVVPTLTVLCSVAVCVGIVLNFLALWLNLRAEKQ